MILPRLDEAELCAADTDSFMIRVKAKSEEEVFERLSPVLDTSNFPTSHPMYSTASKRLPGYIK